MLPKPERFSGGFELCVAPDPMAKLPNAPMGEKPAAWAVGQAAELDPPALAVVLRFTLPKGRASVLRDLSLSRSSGPEPEPVSLISVRRLSRAGGGVVVLFSSLAKREPMAGDVGNGYASLVSRRRFPGRADVGEDRPYPPGLF